VLADFSITTLPEQNGTKMIAFFQQVVNGITMGSLYALVALGYTMVYGVLKMVNFAHGELFMLGPMFSLFLLQTVGLVTGRLNQLPAGMAVWQILLVIALCFITAFIFSAILGLIMERTVYRSLRNRNAVSAVTMIAAMGVSVFLQNATMLIFGHAQKGYPNALTLKTFNVGGLTFTNMQVFIILFGLVLLIGLSYLVNKTYLGRSFRAVATDRCAAGLMGINVNAVIAFVFILGAASGVLYGMSYGQIFYMMGSLIGIKGWIAAIIGGIGNIKGAVIGGFLLGLFEVIGAGYLPVLTRGAIGPEYRNIVAYALLIAVLLVRPQGLYGKRGVS
jgi:branched-chain amino acid transport system permease protein